jgi:hypothetical protein
MSEEPKPYVAADSTMPELTVKAVVLGVLMAAVLGAANAYLGVKAGQTVSATFPAAVLAIAAFRLPFLRGSVLEQNIARTSASVGEALVAGAIFTIPAFVMVSVGGERLWTKFNYWETSFILLIGGLLGIFFIILLRRTLTVDSGLPFPESRACAEIVKAGQAGESGAKYVFGAMGLGMLLQIFKDGAGLRLFRESVEFVRELPASVVKHFDSSRVPLGRGVAPGGDRRRDAGDLAGADRRRLRHRLPPGGDQLLGRPARLAGLHPAGALPQPGPRPAAHGGRRGAADDRGRLLDLVQPGAADRRRRHAGRRHLDAVGHALLAGDRLPRGAQKGERSSRADPPRARSRPAHDPRSARSRWCCR